MIVRQINKNDLDGMHKLAKKAGTGITTLQDDKKLLQKRLEHTDWSPGSKVLILTGGSDVSKLGETLPAQLDEMLGKDAEVHWVRGPFSCTPNLPNSCRLNWTIYDSPEHLDELIVQSDYVMTVFGVSFFVPAWKTWTNLLCNSTTPVSILRSLKLQSMQ